MNKFLTLMSSATFLPQFIALLAIEMKETADLLEEIDQNMEEKPIE